MRLINKIPILVFLLLLPMAASVSARDIVSEVKVCFANQEFSKGIKILNKELFEIRGLERSGAKNERTALKHELMLMSAKFYDDYVGDLNRAKGGYEKLLLDSDSSTSLKQKLIAQEKLDRIDSFSLEYRTQMRFLQKLKSDVRSNKTSLKEAVDSTSNLISNTQNEYILANAHFYLSEILLAQEEYWLSYEAVNKSYKTKPAIDFLLPAKNLKETAYKHWLLIVISKLCWGIMAGMLIFIPAVFYFSIPWQWINLRIVGFTIAIGLVFAVLCMLIIGLAGKMTDVPENYVSAPIYFEKYFKSFNTRIPSLIILYSLVSFAGSICLVISTSKFKCSRTWKLINAVAVAILFSAMFSIFTLKYCIDSSIYSLNSFNREKGRAFSYLSGTTFFRMRDIRPFVLTNPRAYPDLGTVKMDEVVFARWIETQRKIIESDRELNNP